MNWQILKSGKGLSRNQAGYQDSSKNGMDATKGRRISCREGLPPSISGGTAR